MPNADCRESEKMFKRSIASARELGAPGWELRTAISFVRFSEAKGRMTDAWKALASARGRFSTAEASVDLREADDLLKRGARRRYNEYS
jgi:hypothetical protein